LAYFVQNLTVFDMISSYLMLFLTLAFVASFEKKEKVSKIKDLNFGVFSLIFISFLASFSFFVLLPAVSSASVISSLKADSTQRKIELERFAINLSPLGRKQIRQFFAENFSSRIIRTQKIEKEDLVEVEFLTKELQKNIQENPLDFRSYYLIGNILTISSQPDNLEKGEEILRKAIELWPNNQKAYWVLAQNLLLQKRFDEAISLAQKAVDLEPKLKDSHLILIQILKITQRYDLIEEATKRALSIDPGWESEIQQILSTS
jgi:tetratricopeptide (TPR) repeat protein